MEDRKPTSLTTFRDEIADYVIFAAWRYTRPRIVARMVNQNRICI